MTIEGKRQSIPLTEGPSRAAARFLCAAPDSQRTICTSPSSASPTPGPKSAPAMCICTKSLKLSKREFAKPRHAMESTHHHLRRHHMGTQGMKASLVSREVIADSIELVARQSF